VPSMDLQTGRDFALFPDPHRPWALPRGPAPEAFRPCPPDQPCAVWMRALPGAYAEEQNMTGKKRSEKRQRTVLRPARFTPEEAARFDAKAAPYGGASAFIRYIALDHPLPRSKVEIQMLSQVRRELSKIGTNINQIAHRYNMTEGRPSGNIEGALETALNELLEWRMALMQALGYERNRKPHD
jgi:Bacterial mobilisation protein (MobC)